MSDEVDSKKITEDYMQETFKSAVKKVIDEGMPPSAERLITLLQKVMNDESALEDLRKEIVKRYGE
tara:strand:+ start:4249 stop:4446 length:198 start_codon:yes stop_codon:yes gene_type:complete